MAALASLVRASLGRAALAGPALQAPMQRGFALRWAAAAAQRPAGPLARALHQTACSCAAAEEDSADDGLAMVRGGALATSAGETALKAPTSAAHPNRGRGPSTRPRNRYAQSMWWRGWLVGPSGERGVEGDFPVACVEEVDVESEDWDDAWDNLDLTHARGMARVVSDSEEGDFPIVAGDVVYIKHKLGPVGALGRSGALPAAFPPKLKNERRRAIARELQRQRDGKRRRRETAAAGERKAETRAAKMRVASEMTRRAREGELPTSRVARVQAHTKAELAANPELDAWAKEMLGEEAYRPPSGRAKGVSLVH